MIRFPLVALSLASPLAVLSQGTFQNLDFESAKVSGYSTGGVPITDALPGWRGYLGISETSIVFYNTVSLGAAAISLQGPGSLFPPIAGNYSVGLQSAFGVAPDGTAAVGQTGQIPSTALSLRFYGDTNMQVTFIGQLLTLFLLGTGPNYQIVGADISGFAGQTGELKFLMPDLTPVGSSSSYLDNIVFSNQTIPEPNTLGLFAVGALLFGYRSRRLT
jgi:hypothetical protein